MAQSDRARLAVDIGGTFTDVVLEIPGGRRVTTKLLTTYAHPGEAVLKGIAEVLRQQGYHTAGFAANLDISRWPFWVRGFDIANVRDRLSRYEFGVEGNRGL